MPTRIQLLIPLLILGVAVPAAAQKKKDPKLRLAAAHYKQGKEYFRLKLYDKAVEEYRKAFDLSPRPQLHYNIGRALHEKGDLTAALASYKKYLDAKPNGRAADETRESVARITKKMTAAADAERLRKQLLAKQKADAERRRRKAKVDGLVAQANAFLGKKLYDDALRTFATAYDLGKDSELLFDIAEIHRTRGKDSAIGKYQQYIDAAPAGKRADAARGHIATLTRARDERTRRLTALQSKRRAKRGIKWTWLTAGAALFAAGLVLDLVPKSGRDDMLEARDFAPVGLYGAGLTAIGIGVF